MNDISQNKGESSDYLAQIIKSVMASPDGKTQNEQIPQSDNNSASSPTADIFSSLLSNPELLSKLPSLISTVKPIIEMLGGLSKSENSEKASDTSVSVSASPAHSANTGQEHRHSNTDHRSALLCAMKPYLSHDRQEAIDYIIKLGKLGDILKTL